MPPLPASFASFLDQVTGIDRARDAAITRDASDFGSSGKHGCYPPSHHRTYHALRHLSLPIVPDLVDVTFPSSIFCPDFLSPISPDFPEQVGPGVNRALGQCPLEFQHARARHVGAVENPAREDRRAPAGASGRRP